MRLALIVLLCLLLCGCQAHLTADADARITEAVEEATGIEGLDGLFDVKVNLYYTLTLFMIR